MSNYVRFAVFFLKRWFNLSKVRRSGAPRPQDINTQTGPFDSSQGSILQHLYQQIGESSACFRLFIEWVCERVCRGHEASVTDEG